MVKTTEPHQKGERSCNMMLTITRLLLASVGVSSSPPERGAVFLHSILQRHWPLSALALMWLPFRRRQAPTSAFLSLQSQSAPLIFSLHFVLRVRSTRKTLAPARTLTLKMAATIAIVVGTLAATYVFLRILLHVTQDAREPPAILTEIPFVSPIIGMLRDKTRLHNILKYDPSCHVDYLNPHKPQKVLHEKTHC